MRLQPCSSKTESLDLIMSLGDGGAYPECHIAQYPLEMGKKKVRIIQNVVSSQ